MRKINQIVVHCALTKPSMNVDAQVIRRWHVEENGWRDIGYHYVIKRDGTLETGRPESQQGAHVAGHNAHSIGICLAGGLDEDNQPDSNFTRYQFTTLETLIHELIGRYPGAAVCGHRDLTDAKDCPLFDVKQWWSS